MLIFRSNGVRVHTLQVVILHQARLQQGIKTRLLLTSQGREQHKWKCSFLFIYQLDDSLIDQMMDFDYTCMCTS